MTTIREYEITISDEMVDSDDFGVNENMTKFRNFDGHIKVARSMFKLVQNRVWTYRHFWTTRMYATLGVPKAKAVLGAMYSKGVGVKKNDSESLKWYNDAAKLGNVSAQLILGVRYSEGIGVVRDYSEALRWYHKAARQNNPKAQGALGLIYATGLGTRKDLVLACVWFNLSVMGGFKEILVIRDNLESQLSFDQVTEVRKFTYLFSGGVDNGGISSRGNS